MDALNAATDFNDDYDIEEMEEVSVDSHHFALKKLVFEMEVKPLIKYDFPKSKNCCAFWKDVWALCLKKQCYLFGRWQQGFVQVCTFKYDFFFWETRLLTFSTLYSVLCSIGYAVPGTGLY